MSQPIPSNRYAIATWIQASEASAGETMERTPI